MAMDLRNFNYDLETNEGVLPKGPNSISSGARSIAGKVIGSSHKDDFVILDSQRVPQNKLEAIERQMIKINRHIQDKFGSADNLTSQLKSFADKDKNNNVTVD